MNELTRLDAIYARQSVDKADSISIESQIEFCKYETRGAPYLVYSDKGYSGKNTQRPEFQRMLTAIRRGEIKRVICYRLDRCSRSILDFTNLISEFQKFDVEFVSCTEKFDTSTPMGRAMLNICIVFAQLERETIQQRVLDTYHARSKRGFYMGGRIPFGFRTEPYCIEGKQTSRYTIIDDEAAILKFMYDIYEKSTATLSDVVKALHNTPIIQTEKQISMWTRSHIGRMLRNPIYVKADINIYQYFTANGVTLHNPAEDFIGINGCYLFTEKNGADKTKHLVIAPHEGFIPSDIWLRCRKKAGHNSHPINNRAKNTFLTGKIKCEKCGYALVVRKTEKSGKVYRYFICSGASQNRGKCNGMRGMNAGVIESLIFTHITRKLVALPVLSCDKKLSDASHYLHKWELFSIQDKIAVIDLLIEKISLEERKMQIHWKI